MRTLPLALLLLLGCDPPASHVERHGVTAAAARRPPPDPPATASAEPAAPPLAPMLARDWQVLSGQFTFEPDGTLTAEGSRRSSLVVLRGVKARDLDVSVDVLFLGPESSAGIVFRASGADFLDDASGYQFEWYTDGTHHDRRLSIMKKDPGWVQLEEHTRSPECGRWIRFRVVSEGARLQGFIDGERVVNVSDRQILREGKVGLHVYQARKVRFRDFQWKALPRDGG